MNPQQNWLLALLPLFPLIGAAINGLFGARIQAAAGKKAVHTIAIIAPALSAVVAWVVFFQLMGRPPEERAFSWVGWDWIVVGFADARWAYWVDPLSGMMLLIITTIGTMIHVYSTGYMADEPSYWRFFAYLNLFVSMMLILVLGDSFLLMFVGWEGVGLASYLLIGFYYKDLGNAASGMKAFVVNRFGDAAFVIGLFLLFWGVQGSWVPPSGADAALDTKPAAFAPLQKYVHDDGVREAELLLAVAPPPPEVNSPAALQGTLTFQHMRKIFDDEVRREAIVDKTFLGLPLLFLVCVLFFLGATAKSAQIPFYIWLPDAMAGPTPVSALIHAATMVTAGVYMIARLNFIYILSPGACTVVALTGATTALFAATMGLFQYDIKKVLAYSTISQLVYMFVGVGVGAYWAGVFHLLTHACFKACLFLGSGSVILGCHHEQDMRRMGGLKKYMPTTHKTYLWACIAIAGFPLAAGFCSKDEILWKAISSGAVFPGANFVIWGMGLAAAGCTAFYMFRSYYMTFSGEYRGNDVPLVDPYPADTARAKDLFIPKAVRGPSDEMIAELRAHAHHGHGHDDHAHGHDGHGHGHDDHGHGHGHDDHGHGDHHHGGEPHESPVAMTAVLMVLGVASLLIGVIVGFPPFIGHAIHHVTHLGFFEHPMLEHWLEPVLAPSNEVMKAYVEASPMISAIAHNTALEWGLAGLSVLVAFSGFGLARWFYKDNANPLPELLMKDPAAALRTLPMGGLLAPAAEGVTQLHRLIYNKYFVDEVAYTIMVRGGAKFWNACAWFDSNVIDGVVNLVGHVGRYVGYVQGAVDAYLVDGLVNKVASVISAAGSRVRTLQTGQIRNYMVGAFGGAVAAFVILVALAG
jgi:NADH-quinone oxidoreductase subunit L